MKSLHRPQVHIGEPSGEPIAICFKIQWHFENVFLMIYWKTSFPAAPLSIVNGTLECRGTRLQTIVLNSMTHSIFDFSKSWDMLSVKNFVEGHFIF